MSINLIKYLTFWMPTPEQCRTGVVQHLLPQSRLQDKKLCSGLRGLADGQIHIYAGSSDRHRVGVNVTDNCCGGLSCCIYKRISIMKVFAVSPPMARHINEKATHRVAFSFIG